MFYVPVVTSICAKRICLYHYLVCSRSLYALGYDVVEGWLKSVSWFIVNSLLGWSTEDSRSFYTTYTSMPEIVCIGCVVIDIVKSLMGGEDLLDMWNVSHIFSFCQMDIDVAKWVFQIYEFLLEQVKIQRDVHKLLNDIISWSKPLIIFTLNWNESGA